MKNNIILFLLIPLSVLKIEIYSQVNDFSNGVKQLSENQYKKAKNIFYSLTISDPTDCNALFYLGQTYSFKKQFDSAEYYFKKINTVNPESPYAFIVNGIFALKVNDTETVMDMFKKVRKISKKEINIPLLLVDACFENQKPDLKLAEIFLNEIEKAFPQNSAYYMSTAKFYYLKGDIGKAASSYEWAYYYDPKNALAYTKLGQLYTGALLYREALTALNKSIEIDPNQVMVYKYLSDLQYRFGKYPEAKKAYLKYMSVAEESNDNVQRYALILFYNREFKEAADELNKVILKDPSNPFMNRVMAYVAYENGDYDGGMKSITKFFESKDTIKLLATDYLYYGKLLLKTGNDSAGIVNIKKALQMDEAKTDAYKELAVALSKHKKHDDAIVIYERLISKGVEKPNSYFNIAKEYYYKGQSHKDIYNSSILMATTTADKNLISLNDSILAMQSFAKADSFFSLVILITPDFADGYLWKGRMLSLIDVNMEKGLAKEPYEKALSLLEKNNVVQNISKITECYKYLAAYNYYQSENLARTDKDLSASLKTKAIEYYQKIVSLNPSDMQAKEVLDELTKPPKKGNTKKQN